MFEVRYSMDGDLFASLRIKEREIVVQVHKAKEVLTDNTVIDTFLYKIDGRGFMPYSFALNEMINLVELEYCSTAN